MGHSKRDDRVMWTTLLQILNPSGIVQSIIEGRNHKREFKQEVHKQKLKNVQQGRIAEAEWNNTALVHAGWKDEWLTMILSAPLILAFMPSMVPHLNAGFKTLETMPVWYQAAIGVMIAASFGYKKYADTMMRKAYTLPRENNEED